MQIGSALPPVFRPHLAAPARPGAEVLPAQPSDAVEVSAPEALQSVALSGRFSAFQVLDPGLGTIRCAQPELLKARAARLEQTGIRLIGVRHGESQANAHGGGAILSGRGDSPLTEAGQEQARQAAAQVFEQLGGAEWLRGAAADPQQLPVLVASPLARAYDTGTALQQLLISQAENLLEQGRISAAELATVRGLTVEKDPDLQEIDFGRCEGADARNVSKTYPNFGKGLDFLHRFPGGEAGLDVMDRVDRFLDRVENQWKGRTVLFFAHTMSLGLTKVMLGDTSHDPAGRLHVDRSKLPNATPMTLLQPARTVPSAAGGWYIT